MFIQKELDRMRLCVRCSQNDAKETCSLKGSQTMTLTLGQHLFNLPGLLKKTVMKQLSFSWQAWARAMNSDPFHSPSLTSAVATLPPQGISYSPMRRLGCFFTLQSLAWHLVSVLPGDQCPASFPHIFLKTIRKMLPDQAHPFKSHPHSHLSESPAGTGVLPSKTSNKLQPGGSLLYARACVASLWSNTSGVTSTLPLEETEHLTEAMTKIQRKGS